MKRLLTLSLPILLLTACVPVSKVADSLSSIQLPTLGQSNPSTPSKQKIFSPARYARLLNDTIYGFRFSESGEPVRRGTTAERFEVRDGDCSGSDCGNPRYRSEIREDERRLGSLLQQDTWFGWSFYNESIPTLPRSAALKPVFGQWKVDGQVPPAIRVIQIGMGDGNWNSCDPAICNRSSDTRKDVVLQLDDMQRTRNWGALQNEGYICKLFSMADNQGKWVDLVINTNFAADNSGYVRAWVNGEQVCNYTGRVIATTPAVRRFQPNHRRGIFVSYTKRWDDTRPGQPKPTMIAYYDEYLAGPTRESVDTRLREANGQSPKD